MPKVPTPDRVPAPIPVPTPSRSAESDRMIGAIETFLQDAITHLAPDPSGREARGPGSTRRVLPALLLWSGLLVCVLRGFGSHLALWRLLSQYGLWGYPPVPLSDQAVYARLERGGTSALAQLFAQISQALQERLAPYAETKLAAFASGVYALDEMTFDAVARLLPTLRGLPASDTRRLPGKLTGLFNLRLQQWQRVEHQADPHQNEKVAARGMLADLPAGSLLLADLGYFGFAWFDWLTDHACWWISRLRAKTSYQVVHTFYHRGETLDALIWLGAYRADRSQHLARLVQFQVGATTFRYVTNVLDPRVLSLAEIARLYARRWDIELAFLTLKRQLGLAYWWSAKDVVVQQQVWATLIIAQILQALRLEIAGRAGVDPFEVSLPLLIKYLPFFARVGDDPLRAFIEDGRRLRFIRPSSRTHIQAPTLPADQILAPPADLLRERVPRYAGKQGEHRPAARATEQA